MCFQSKISNIVQPQFKECTDDRVILKNCLSNKFTYVKGLTKKNYQNVNVDTNFISTVLKKSADIY